MESGHRTWPYPARGTLMNTRETRIADIIESGVAELERPDLFRTPLVGFSAADDPRYHALKEIVGDWVREPVELFPDAKSVISYFVPFTKLVARSTRKTERETPLWGEAYVVMNAAFDHISQAVCAYLDEEGCSSYMIQATHTYNEADMKSMWSHRSAAAIAGLGYFSANRMLVTAKGSGGRFCSVLTSAALEGVSEVPENACPYLADESCGLCFKACPVHALKPGSIYRPACQAVTRENEQLLSASIGLDGADTCGRCVGICPLSYIA